MTISRYLIIIFLTLLNVPAFAKNWEINKESSKIEFFGTHMGKDFNGKLEDVTGKIEFDPKNLKGSFAKINIGLMSATTGNEAYDKTLPQDDWLNSKIYPNAVYETTKISKIENTRYKVEGFLIIRSVKLMHNFDADIEIEENIATLTATTKIKRLDFGIGKSSDSNGDWVSLDIPLKIELKATSN